MTGAQTGAGHTPTPWRFVKDDRILGNDYVLLANFKEHNGETEIGVICGGKPNEKGLANARKIVHAVNSHAELLAALKALTDAVDALIAESDGVYGLHLNGDPAPWESLTEGGSFEGWLSPLEIARTAIANAERAERHQEGGAS